MKLRRKLYSYLGFRELVPEVVNLSKELVLKLEDKPKLAKLLGKINYIKKKQDKYISYSININNKQVGNLYLNEENSRELEFEIYDMNLNIKPKHFDLIINWILNNAKDWGFIIVTSQFFPTEITTNVANVYDKYGFEEVYDHPSLVIYEKRL